MASYHVEIKSGKKGMAAEHARYVSRQGKHSMRDDLVDTGYGNMPSWAEHQPSQFWKAADKFERANGAAYRELIIAVPNEFNTSQAGEFINQVVTDVIKDRPYQYALHAPDAALGNTTNTHVHLMYSDRRPDGIERPPERTFSRFNRQQPEKGGRRKASGGMNSLQLRDDVIARRKAIADIQNRMLKNIGCDVQVDHRSYGERGINRQPERHLGLAKISRMSREQKTGYAKLRGG